MAHEPGGWKTRGQNLRRDGGRHPKTPASHLRGSPDAQDAAEAEDRSPDEHELLGQLRMTGGKLEGDRAAHRVSEHEGALDVQRATDLCHAIGEGLGAGALLEELGADRT